MNLLSENEKRIRKIWAILFFLMPLINFFISPSPFSQLDELEISRSFIITVWAFLSSLFLAIMYLVYYRIYKKHGTWLLTFFIITYPPTVLYQMWNFYSGGMNFAYYDVIVNSETLLSFYLNCRLLMINKKIRLLRA